MKVFRALAFAVALVALSPIFALAQTTTFNFDPTIWRSWLNDFDRYVEADFVLTTTEAGAGSSTEVLTSIDNGALLVTNDNADDDRDFYTLPSEGFKWTTDKRSYFKARFKISDVTQSDFIFGLQITDTTPLDVTDGIFFQKDDGDAFLDFHVEKSNVASDATAVATLVNDTFVTISFYYEPGSAAVKYYVNDILLGSLPLTNIPNTEELTVSFGLQNGEAVAKNMTVDYVFATEER